MTRIMTDGFELNDYDGWSKFGSYTNISCSTAKKRSGLYSLKAISTYWQKSVCYFEKTITQVDDEIYVRFAFNIDSEGIGYMGLRLFNNTTLIGTLYIDERRLRLDVGSSAVAYGPFLDALTWYVIELRYKIHDSAGIIQAKVNGTLFAEYEGDTQAGTATSINKLQFYYYAEDDKGFYLDDLAVNDVNGLVDNSWCGLGRVIAMRPNANGDNSDLVGSDGDSVDNFEMVDEFPRGADYVTGSAPDEYDLYNLESPSLPVTHDIKRVWVEGRAKDESLGDMALMLKSGLTEDISNVVTLSGDYASIKSEDYLLNPDDSAAWEEADLIALQAGAMLK